jgi:Zn-finger nucleic acid-binding protein
MTSKNEDEYFAKRDAELKQRMAAQQAKASEAEERRTHLMRCPKCGGHMKVQVLHNVTVEQCGDCRGIFLDDGELDQLGGQQDGGLLGKVFGDLKKALNNKTDAK